MSCDNTCSQIVSIPGARGATGTPGTDGTDGTNACTTTTASFEMPDCLYDTEVTVEVEDSSCFCIGGVVFIETAGYFRVIDKPEPDATHLVLENLCLPVNATAGTIIASDQQLCTSGEPGEDGTDGAPGSDGTDGANICTVTTADFLQPAELSNVTIEVESSVSQIEGETIFVETGGYYQVANIPDATHLEITNLKNSATGEYPDNAAPGATISLGAMVCPTGAQGVPGPYGPEGPIGPTGPSGAVGDLFKAYVSTQQIINGGGTGETVELDTVAFDPDGVYDPVTFTWTAPETGFYQFTVHLQYVSISDAMTIHTRVYKNGVPGVGTLVANFTGEVENEVNACHDFTTILELSQNDTIIVNSFNATGGQTATVEQDEASSWFCGYRVR